jgi:hypothetical protein
MNPQKIKFIAAIIIATESHVHIVHMVFKIHSWEKPVLQNTKSFVLMTGEHSLLLGKILLN